MKKFILFLAVLAVGALWGFSLSSCAYAESADETIRYKMTVEVETPEGIKTGSAVREVYVHAGWSALPEIGRRVSLRGEAVIIDLGQRGILFALMRGMHGVDYAGRVLWDAFPSSYPPLSNEGIKYYRDLKMSPTVLKPYQYPMLVFFEDIKNPLTVKALSPYEERATPDGYGGQTVPMSTAFGSGVRISSIKIEPAQEGIASVIQKILPWLLSITSNLDGSTITTSNKIYNVLNIGDFKREDPN